MTDCSKYKVMVNEWDCALIDLVSPDDVIIKTFSSISVQDLVSAVAKYKDCNHRL